MSRAEAGSGSFKGGGVADVSVRACVGREERGRAEVVGAPCGSAGEAED